MTRAFPQNFDLRLLKGSRAQQFTKPEDAFQQMLGDALKEMAGPYAHISPTRGRDGSIDAFLVEGAMVTGPFQNLLLPLIVECKTHEDTSKGIQRNILGQWAAMERKLETQALDGWRDLFEPWLAARSYTYCLSAQFPNEQTRNKLCSAIEAFFTSLPKEYRPPIDCVRVVDWNDLRQWIESLPRVSDAWLGIELELILDHETYLDRFSGFREYLLPSKLEFVPPPSESLFHPARLLEEIEKIDSRRETLLVGTGGIGKTRTAIEVGTLAANAGWRVLHILPDEPGIEIGHIAESVLPYFNSRILLILDYLDQMHRLDLGSIRRSLIPSALERRIQLRFLANCRPGWLRSPNAGRDELFSVIELRPTDPHKRKLIETMASRIAPTASAKLGKDEVIRLCGTRAIIALLIARELENRAAANLLTDIDTATLRSGDLVQWLRRRLQENSLSVSHDELSLVPHRPEIPMVAAAAALACAPETGETLVLASESAYRDLQWPTAGEDARFLVDLLLKFGWLEAHGLFNATPHDVVADEVLDQTIHSEVFVFESELKAVLSCSFTIPRGIGRLATALRRVLGAISEEEAQNLTSFLQAWLTTNASQLGEILKQGDPDLTSYALGALISGPPWEESAIDRWEEIFLPWLEAHSTKEEARHLLYKGLKRVQSSEVDLITPALTWIKAHSFSRLAIFVIAPLLDRAGLSIKDNERIIEFSFFWLELHHSTLEAGFVLPPLLERQDLSGEAAEQVKRFALLWLELQHGTVEAGFVLKPLLERMEVGSEGASSVVQNAVNWLRTFYTVVEAAFVLRKLFRRDDVPQLEREVLMTAALKRLRERLHDDDTSFLFRACLQYRINNDFLQQELVTLAMEWLDLHEGNPDGQYLWNRVLRYPPRLVSDQNWSRVAKHAVSWLGSRTSKDRDVEQTTNSALMRSYCLDPVELQYVVTLGIELLKTSLHPLGRRKLIGSLAYLRQNLPDDDLIKYQINDALSSIR